VNGAFSERFAMIARACGHESVTYEVPWGEVHDPAKVDELLAGGKFSAVTVVHSETSTGARNPIREISDAAHRRGARCLIDSVSGLGGLELRFDDWKLDFVLTGSQKALALPPGLSFGAASEDFIREANTAPVRGIYFDLLELIAFARKGQTPSTPAVSLFYALVTQLDAIVAEGIESRWARHCAMAKMVSDWSDSVAHGPNGGFTNIVARESRSNTVSTLRLPSGWKAPDFLKAVKQRGFVLGGGYGKLAEGTFRIGHMGDHSPDTVRALLTAVTATEHDQNRRM
jgi:aspartate aminotransferase-like enzyme